MKKGWTIMFESIFLWLAIISEIIVIMACIIGNDNKIDKSTLAALIIFAGVCMVLASIMGRLNL